MNPNQSNFGLSPENQDMYKPINDPGNFDLKPDENSSSEAETSRFRQSQESESSLNERSKVSWSVSFIEDNLNDYYDRKINADNLCSKLGNIADAQTGQEHPTVQLYAFDCLFKALSEVESIEEANEIFGTIILNVALLEEKDKENLFLAILLNYASDSNYKKIITDIKYENRPEGQPENQSFSDFEKIHKYLRICAGRALENKNRYTPEEIKVIDHIVNDFNNLGPEEGSIRMFANFYRADPNQIVSKLDLPNLPEYEPSNSDGSFQEETVSSGKPNIVVRLREGYCPSREKINEAREKGWILPIVVVADDGHEKKYFDYDINAKPNLIDRYLSRIRDYKDKSGNKSDARVKLLENSLKARILRDLDYSEITKNDPQLMETIQKMKNEPEDVTYYKSTIRDKSVTSDQSESVA